MIFVATIPPFNTGILTIATSFPTIGITRKTAIQVITIPMKAIKTVFHSSINCFTFTILPIWNTNIGLAKVATLSNCAFAIRSEGITPVINKIRNPIKAMNTDESLAFVATPKMSPIANKPATILSIKNFSISTSPL